MEVTGGRIAMDIFASLLTQSLPRYPSLMIMGLVDGKTGQVLWFQTSPGAEYNFMDQGHMEQLVRHMVKDFLTVRMKKGVRD